MDIISLYSYLLSNPDEIRWYKELVEYYKLKNKVNEELAFVYLLEKKIEKNNNTNIK